MVASLIPASALASFPAARRRRKNNAGPKGLVNTSQRKSEIDAIAMSSSTAGSRTTVRMQGYSSTSAPSARSSRQSVPFRSAGRVTITRLPLSGRLSNQSKRSDSAQTLPTTIMAGLLIFASCAACGSSASVEMILRWLGSVPLSTTAAGISSSMPARSNPLQISGSVDTPMRNTRVPPVRRSASKSIFSSASAFAWPAMICSDEQKSRCVTGMPA